MSSSLAQNIVRAWGGDWYGNYGTAPAPGHSRKDRSVSIRPHSSDPDDVIVQSFAGEDPLAIKDEMRRQGLLPTRSGRFRVQLLRSPAQEAVKTTAEAEGVRRSRELALSLWRRSQPIVDTPAERYLREKRAIAGPLLSTLRFLPASGKYPPAMIAAFGLADEPEPGVLRVEAPAIYGVHLTKLRPDGLDKADMEPNKIMLGRGHTLPIMLAPVNDNGGLAITEGIEEALAVRDAWGLGAWAAGCASRLPELAKHVPAFVECVTVLIDPEPAGERFGNELVDQLERRGLEVFAVPVRAFESSVLRLREAGYGR